MEKYCTNCSRVFKDSDFKICPYCGKHLSIREGRQPIPRKLRHQVFQRDGYRCRECGATNKQTRLHVDHIKPVAKGGTNDLSNLQTLCEDCNRAKYTDEWVGGRQDNNSEYDQRIALNEKRGRDYFLSFTKKCPNCNTVIDRKAKKCVICGHKFKKRKSNYSELDDPNKKLRKSSSNNSIF